MGDKAVHILIDLLDDTLVIHVTGQERGVSYGTYDLKNEYEKYKQKLSNIGKTLVKKGWQGVAMNMIEESINEIGTKFYREIIQRDDKIDNLYQMATRDAGYRVSLSFRLDKDYISLPVEFLRDHNQHYIAANIPVYKTLTTRGDTYPKSSEIDFKKELNVLLLSSNTYLKPLDKFTVGTGNQEKEVNFTLPNVAELDGLNNEIDTIDKIIKQAIGKGKKILPPKVCHTDDLDCGTFLDLIASDEYDIIHYNGHGYFDLDNSNNNFIFFWKERKRNGGIAAVNTNLLARELKKATRLKFFYLSCCQGAASEESFKRFHNTYLGFLDAIIYSGVPNALGMRWPISITDSKNFASNFYNSFFVYGNTLEASVSNSRSEALNNYDDKSVWCSPVLIKQDL